MHLAWKLKSDILSFLLVSGQSLLKIFDKIAQYFKFWKLVETNHYFCSKNVLFVIQQSLEAWCSLIHLHIFITCCTFFTTCDSIH